MSRTRRESDMILMQTSCSFVAFQPIRVVIFSLALNLFEVCRFIFKALQQKKMLRETQHETNHILLPQKWLLNACNMLLMLFYCLFLNLLSITKMQFTRSHQTGIGRKGSAGHWNFCARSTSCRFINQKTNHKVIFSRKKIQTWSLKMSILFKSHDFIFGFLYFLLLVCLLFLF